MYSKTPLMLYSGGPILRERPHLKLARKRLYNGEPMDTIMFIAMICAGITWLAVVVKEG